MRKKTYLAVFELTATGYGVYFPDVPGCITVGNNFAEAEAYAKEALSLHIYGMEKDGDPLPIPSVTPEIDPDIMPGYLTSSITIFPDLV